MKQILFLLSFLCLTGTSFAICTDTIKPASPFIISGNSIVLTDVSGSGTWSSSNTVMATIGSATGVLKAISYGTVTITHTTSLSCSSTKTFTIYPPTVVTVSAGNSLYVTINNQDYRRATLGTYYKYALGDSELTFYNSFSQAVIIPATVDTNFYYVDSSYRQARSMPELRAWMRTNLQ